jgi:hypothetical protein
MGDNAVTVLVDDDWEYDGRLGIGSHGYCWMYDSVRNQVLVHRHLLGLRTGDGLFGDHINRNRLDNRRSNLRAVSGSVSNLNRPQMDGEFVNIYRTRTGRWEAKFIWQRQRHHVGTFDDRLKAKEALTAYRQQVVPNVLSS